MSFHCSDVLKVFSDSKTKIDVLGGKENMDRVIRWVYVADIMDSILSTINWLSGYELVVVVGVNLSGDPAGVLVEFIRLCAKKRIAGVVINTGEYIPFVPKEAIDTANELGMPLMVVPWETRMVEFTKAICTAIVERSIEDESTNVLANCLLFGQPFSPEAKRQLSKLDMEGAGAYTIVLLEPIEESEPSVQNKIALHTSLLERVRRAFGFGRQPVITCVGGAIIVILALDDRRRDCRAALEKLVAEMSLCNSPLPLRAAIGRPCGSLSEIPQSWKSAQQVMQVCRFDTSRRVADYSDMGVYSLLLSVPDEGVMLDFYQELFQPLIEYDKSNHASLLHTLSVYVEYDASLAATAKALYVHENTLKYRLNKIRAMMNVDPGRLEDLTRISIGLKIGRLLRREEAPGPFPSDAPLRVETPSPRSPAVQPSEKKSSSKSRMEYAPGRGDAAPESAS